MTDAEKVAILVDAAKKADRILLEIEAVAEINSIARGIGNRKCSDWTQSVARRARKALQAALKRTEAGSACTATVGSASPANKKAIRIDIAAMKANGILKEAKRK